VRINFSDLRRSTRKNAEAALNKHLPSLQKDRPAGTLITASLLEVSCCGDFGQRN
jgi:hypothetical protein